MAMTLAMVGAATLGSATLATAAPTPHATVNFTGIVALDDCSGSLVRTPNSAATDPALVLTNGHCIETGFLKPGQVIVNQASTRQFDLLDPSGNDLATLQANDVLYSTMTDTDITLYRLNTTYQAIQQKYGATPLTLATKADPVNAAIKVVSGYWQKIYSCNINGYAYEVQENGWTWQNSIRYTKSCNVIGGTSGSPVIDPTSDQIVGINNTINEDGQRCTLDNPCEIDQNGNVTIHKGIGYAEETYLLDTCLDTGNVLDLNRADCTLPKASS
ncbi:MAG TPA: serine protease [Pseudonocardiaceae bacterium]|jgi:V8-like Glu-specific endopeptidase|nr:serine protease [Pseudonocardiaceae bacterium]